jgi:hypothetical protein
VLELLTYRTNCGALPEEIIEFGTPATLNVSAKAESLVEPSSGMIPAAATD